MEVAAPITIRASPAAVIREVNLEVCGLERLASIPARITRTPRTIKNMDF